ncbi:MAG: hypothetical protein ABSD74_09680 [Rhizomicrobium sp.]|jgi:hypothetical protein
MKTLAFLTLAAALVVSPVFAAEDDSQGPLPPGHAAGTVDAPLVDGGAIWWLAGGAAVVGAVAIPLASKHSSSTTKTTGAVAH